MTLETKPCPFCNGERYLPSAADHNDLSRNLFWVECRGCETEGPTALSDEEAVALWDTRVHRKPKELIWAKPPNRLDLCANVYSIRRMYVKGTPIYRLYCHEIETTVILELSAYESNALRRLQAAAYEDLCAKTEDLYE